MKNQLRVARLFVFPTLFMSMMLFAVGANGQQASTPQAGTARYKDASLSIEDRVADLLPRMTLEEKVDQIATGWENRIELIDPSGTYTNEQARKLILNEWGAEMKLTPRQYAILRNGVQRYQREKSRLGIPVMFYSESLHGLDGVRQHQLSAGAGVGQHLGSGAGEAGVHRGRRRGGSRGVGQVYSPVLDIARDPRWGRTEETYGEDPYLVSRMGVAAIEGLQGDSFLIDRHHVLATAKHFAVHGQPEGGTNTAPGNYSERIIRENFLVPFQAAVQEAHVGSVMASYNEIDGVPSHMNRWLLEKVLREEWGFRGYVTSDADGLECWRPGITWLMTWQMRRGWAWLPVLTTTWSYRTPASIAHWLTR